MPDAILDHQQPTRAQALRSVADALVAAAGAVEQAASAIAFLALEPEAPPAGPDEYLTVSEVARSMKRSAGFIRSQVRSGALKALRDGRTWRIRRSALESYERRRTA